VNEVDVVISPARGAMVAFVSSAHVQSGRFSTVTTGVAQGVGIASGRCTSTTPRTFAIEHLGTIQTTA